MNFGLKCGCHPAGRVLPVAAQEIPERPVDRLLGLGYRIFTGEGVEWAKLRFTPERAHDPALLYVAI